MALPLVYNLQHIRRRPTATLATAVGIALVVAILIGGLALARGFEAALAGTGSLDNVILVRHGSDSELTSGLSLEVADIVRASPEIATGPDGRPLVSREVMVNTNKPRIGQRGESNVTIRGVDMGRFKYVETLDIPARDCSRPEIPWHAFAGDDIRAMRYNKFFVVALER